MAYGERLMSIVRDVNCALNFIVALNCSNMRTLLSKICKNTVMRCSSSKICNNSLSVSICSASNCELQRKNTPLYIGMCVKLATCLLTLKDVALLYSIYVIHPMCIVQYHPSNRLVLE